MLPAFVTLAPRDPRGPPQRTPDRDRSPGPGPVRGRRDTANTARTPRFGLTWCREGRAHRPARSAGRLGRLGGVGDRRERRRTRLRLRRRRRGHHRPRPRPAGTLRRGIPLLAELDRPALAGGARRGAGHRRPARSVAAGTAERPGPGHRPCFAFDGDPAPFDRRRFVSPAAAASAGTRAVVVWSGVRTWHGEPFFHLSVARDGAEQYAFTYADGEVRSSAVRPRPTPGHPPIGRRGPSVPGAMPPGLGARAPSWERPFRPGSCQAAVDQPFPAMATRSITQRLG